jgi:hypothetical protein
LTVRDDFSCFIQNAGRTGAISQIQPDGEPPLENVFSRTHSANGTDGEFKNFHRRRSVRQQKNARVSPNTAAFDLAQTGTALVEHENL